MRRAAFILLFLLSATGLALAAWLAARTNESRSDRAPREIPPPGALPLELFLRGNGYRERISMLPARDRALLIRWEREWKLAPFDGFGKILKPRWKPGSARADVKVRVKDFPRPGEVGLATFELRHFDEGWRLDLFASEPGYLPSLVNCLEHPVGTLLAYFGAPDSAAMKRYVLEDVLAAYDPRKRTFLAEGLPWSGWKLEDIIELSVDGKRAEARLRLSGAGGKRTEAAIVLERLLGSWFVVREGSFRRR